MFSSDKYEDLVHFLKLGKVCVFETDTVVGLGCIPKSESKLFTIKQRDKNKPIPWLVADTNMAKKYTIWENPKLNWPGPTTYIFKTKSGTLALRQPNVEIIINVMNDIESPIACTSANISGKEPVSSINDVDPKILKEADFVFTKKLCFNKNNKASTIVDLQNLKTLRD